jgi:phosphate transport system substrate-binding protein
VACAGARGCVVAVALWVVGDLAVAQGDPIVLIVNKNNPVESLTIRDLARFYSGEVTEWPSGESIVAINRPIESDIRRRFYRIVLNAPPTQKFFQPGSPIPFETIRVDSDLAIVRFVARLANSIAYCSLSVVDSSVKVIKIDGKPPQAEDYRLP